jgi:uncharacterized protein YdeI (YjbR/CyaY-like superfamily)
MGAKITDVSQLPSDAVLLQYIRRAVELNEKGAPPRAKAKPRPPARVPPDLQAALQKNKKAQTVFDGFPPSQQREYVDWIVEARQQQTRLRRLETALQWIAQGKPRNWKYMKKK